MGWWCGVGWQSRCSLLSPRLCCVMDVVSLSNLLRRRLHVSSINSRLLALSRTECFHFSPASRSRCTCEPQRATRPAVLRLGRAGSRTPSTPPLGPRETALGVWLQVRHRCLPAKWGCGAKSQYDTACSWKPLRGAAGCESGGDGARREPAAAWPARQQVRLAAFPLRPCQLPSASGSITAGTGSLLPGIWHSPRPGEMKKPALRSERLISRWLRR